MNLFDVIKRKDATFDPGLVNHLTMNLGQGKERGVHFSKEGKIVIRNAHELTCLDLRPREPGWEVVALEPGSSDLTIRLNFGEPKESSILGVVRTHYGARPQKVFLNWPVLSATPSEYDLIIESFGDTPIFLSVGPSWSARNSLVATLRGDGVEIGPGSNPAVSPTADVNVRYVENVDAENWRLQYGKNLDPEALAALWQRYIICSAEKLEVVADESLDFIFSSHVFEHLVNPLGVLENWYKKLKPNGVVVGVVPDCRYTFDCRQLPSKKAEILCEYEAKSFAHTREHYAIWVKNSARKSNVEILMREQYSIHVKFYTPLSFLQLLEMSSRQVNWSRHFLQTSMNAKDFGFHLRK